MSAHYVYRIFDDTGRLIYVGSTRHLFQRLNQHRLYAAWWGDQAARASAKVYPTKELATAAELSAIGAENPRWNITGRWKSNLSWTEADFIDYVTALINSPEHGDGTRRRIQRVLNVFQVRNGRPLQLDIPDWIAA